MVDRPESDGRRLTPGWATSIPILILLALSLYGCGGGEKQAGLYCRSIYLAAGSFPPAGSRMLHQDPERAFTVILTYSNTSIPTILRDMLRHAPIEIRKETEVLLSHSLHQGRASRRQTVARLAGIAAFRRVDSFLQRHCPVGSEIANEGFVLAAGR